MDGEKPKTELAMFSPATTPIPVAIADCGDRASERFFTFFTDTVRNKNTRAAYYRNAMRFFAWAAARGLALPAIKSYHVSAYLSIKSRSRRPVRQAASGHAPDAFRLAHSRPCPRNQPGRCRRWRRGAGGRPRR